MSHQSGVNAILATSKGLVGKYIIDVDLLVANKYLNCATF